MSLFRRFRPAKAAAPRQLRLTPQLMAMLRCPTCHRSFTPHASPDADLLCESAHAWPVVAGVPVFSDDGRNVEVRPLDHVSHQPSAAMLDHFRDAPRPWLHLGAGATSVEIPNSIELETAVFKHTHLVGNVHHLPFADASLGGVLALNVFEHLEDPDRAAAELRRCLVPGSTVIVQTAFLQPLHADPYHFYNATETGIRRWFRDFDVRAVTVPPNFNPGFTFSWMSSELLFGSRERPALADATIREIAGFWRDPSTRQGPVWQAFQELPDQWQRVLAAGFEIIATRPDGGQEETT